MRGITLGKGDEVISLAILKHLDATPEERATYLKDAAAQRRALNGEAEDTAEAPVNGDGEETGGEVELGAKRLEMQLAEQFILTVSEKGYGKRSSSFEYRVTGRGGKGIVAMVVNDRNGKLIASFPVEDRDQVMLVTDGGQVIRVPVDAGPGQPHPHRRPLDARRDGLQHRRQREGRLGRAHRRRGRERRRRGRSRPGAGEPERGVSASLPAETRKGLQRCSPFFVEV